MAKFDSDKLKEIQSLNALFEFATEGIIITNKLGIITNANPSSEKLFGYDKGELIGKSVEDLIPQNLKEKHQQHRSQYNINPHSRAMGKDIDLLGRKKDDSHFPVEISLTHFKQGEDLFVIAFIIDISERKAAQEKIIKSNAELELKVGERTKVLQEALNELEQSKLKLSKALEKQKELNDLKSRFVTMASHEFRTPLSAILSSVSLIGKYKNDDDSTKREKHIDRIKSSVTNMNLILNDFLSAEKLEQGKIVLNNSEFNLNLLTEEIIGDLSGLLKSNQEIKFKYLGLDLVFLDKQLTRNILINLISNAIKFSKESTQIKILITNNNQLIEIEIADQGIGIPIEEQKSLFERFYRARNAINIQGTGLGLSIVAKYIEEMRGKITFESKLNVGTKFSVQIPFANKSLN